VNKHFPDISVSPTSEKMINQRQLISHCCYVYCMVDLPLMVALLPLGQQGNEAALQIGGGTLQIGGGTLPTGTEAWPPRPRPAKKPAAT
jgi:hypothetical protein